jgi:hypothetical protein
VAPPLAGDSLGDRGLVEGRSWLGCHSSFLGCKGCFVLGFRQFTQYDVSGLYLSIRPPCEWASILSEKALQPVGFPSFKLTNRPIALPVPICGGRRRHRSGGPELDYGGGAGYGHGGGWRREGSGRRPQRRSTRQPKSGTGRCKSATMRPPRNLSEASILPSPPRGPRGNGLSSCTCCHTWSLSSCAHLAARAWRGERSRGRRGLGPWPAAFGSVGSGAPRHGRDRTVETLPGDGLEDYKSRAGAFAACTKRNRFCSRGQKQQAAAEVKVKVRSSSRLVPSHPLLPSPPGVSLLRPPPLGLPPKPHSESNALLFRSKHRSILGGGGVLVGVAHPALLVCCWVCCVVLPLVFVNPDAALVGFCALLLGLRLALLLLHPCVCCCCFFF